MDRRRFDDITGRYGRLKVVVAGDFCLDRYLHIDPALEEVSLETALPAHQVVEVRPQAGGAGNVLANVAALAPAEVRAVGVIGDDGHGFELTRVLASLGANLDSLIRSPLRKTFTYTKPMVIRPGRPPEELPRLDVKDRTAMPEELVRAIIEHLIAAAADADAVILMDQATDPAAGVLSPPVKRAVADLAGRPMECGDAVAALAGVRTPTTIKAATASPHSITSRLGRVFLADSRKDIGGFAGVDIKVNSDELRRHFDDGRTRPEELAARWARQLGRRVFVTLGPDGMLAAGPDGTIARVAGVPVEGPIDVVGAGDTVLAHLAMAFAAGATPLEAMELANAAGSVVVRKIGTTGTATVGELREAMDL